MKARIFCPGLDEIRPSSALFACSTVAGLALVEPAMGRLDRLGDALEAEQYLFIMPAGELAYIIPALRGLPVSALGILGSLLLLVGLVPAVARLRRRGIDAWSALGWSLIAVGIFVLATEYASHGEWVLPGRIGARYLAFAMLAVGSFLCYRNRQYLATLGMGGFIWDLSSAVFWSFLRKDIRATVPVPWYHHFDREEGRGAPCWLVMAFDLVALSFFAWVFASDFDPLNLFVD